MEDILNYLWINLAVKQINLLLYFHLIINRTIQQEIMRVKSNLPAPIGDGVWMTDVYLKNKNVYYVYKIDDGISASDCTKEDIELVKTGCIEALRGEQTIILRKKKLIEEGIHLIFVYNDSDGKEITRVDIGPDELSKL